MAELRSFIFLDQLQPQTMCYLGTWIRGRLPRLGMAAQIIEIAPGLDIEPLTDVALKHDRVQAGVLVVERQFGYLEIHSRSTAAVQSAAAAVLDVLGATPADATAPQILARKIITRIDGQHAFLINRNKIGSMALAGESLFVLEVQPASYAILATNEAEKAASIKVVDYRMIGATGRVYLSGSEADVRTAADAAVQAVGGEMSEREQVVREVLREVLGELLPALAPGEPAPAPAGGAVPQVPAPPLAAVHRPPGWTAPAGPDPEPAAAPARAAAAPAPGGAVEEVAIRSDEDLNAFALRLLRLYENPRDRQALRSGRLRFALRGGAAGPAAAAPAHRIERGAVTERVVDAAAAAGARLVLGPAAVLTPMARDRARALQVEIEREKRC